MWGLLSSYCRFELRSHTVSPFFSRELHVRIAMSLQFVFRSTEIDTLDPLNSRRCIRFRGLAAVLFLVHGIWPLLCPFVHLLVCSLQEEEDLQSQVTVRRWSPLSPPPYSPQQCGFDGAEIREGCSGFGWDWLGLLFPFICIHLFFPLLSSLSSSLYSIGFPLILLTSCSSFRPSFCSRLLTTSTIPCSLHLKSWDPFYSACLWCSFASPHSRLTCYLLFTSRRKKSFDSLR